ncbi:microtubule-associated tumor suppressor 1 homolog isoform X2 [Callorhinchus milii]|uniref:microtubule-associated tumor suppressor 1 homolog isoform X2 n=1 Tax=Callorhinchus milii TaxID=7868 RepID=UPI001C3F964B|nr:microtubule-associated tumor suppressor 1 homolog isoform X2 [Callorhinchus milii]
MEICKMSIEPNQQSTYTCGECSDIEIENDFHRLIFIDDQNGNGVDDKTRESQETIHDAALLNNRNSVNLDAVITPYNITMEDEKATFEENIFRVPNISRTELEMFRGFDSEQRVYISDEMLSTSSDNANQSMTGIFNQDINITAEHILRIPENQQNSLVRNEAQALNEYHIADLEQRINPCVKNGAHVAQDKEDKDILENHFKCSRNRNDGGNRIQFDEEYSLEYLALPSKFEMKSNSTYGTEESSIETSGFPVTFDNTAGSLEMSSNVFECSSDIEKIEQEAPLTNYLNYKECALVLLNHDYELDKVEKLLLPKKLTNWSTSATKCLNCCQNDCCKEDQDSHSVPDSSCTGERGKYQVKETQAQQLTVETQSCQELGFERLDAGITQGEVYENVTCEKPIMSEMNTTYLLGRIEADVDLNPNPELICSELALNPEETHSMNDTVIAVEESFDRTFLVLSPTVQEFGYRYSQTSTPLVESKTFFSPPIQDAQYFVDVNGCPISTIEEETLPTNLAQQLNTDISEEKPPFKITKSSPTMKAKATKVEIKNYPKPNFNNVKPKVVSRSEQTSTKNTRSPSAGGSCKSSPRSTVSISSIQSSCSCHSPKSLKNEQHPKPSIKPKPVLKFQRVVIQKSLTVSKPPVSGKAEVHSTNLSGRINRTQTRRVPISIPGVDAKEGPRSSHVTSIVANNKLSETFISDGIERIQTEHQVTMSIETASSQHDSSTSEDSLAPQCGSVSHAGSQSQLPTARAPLTKTSVPAICDIQVGRKPSLSNTKGLSVQSPSANLRAPPSASKLRLGSVNKDGHIHGVVPTPKTKPLFTPDKQKGNSTLKGKLRIAPTKAATLNLGVNAVKTTIGFKLPVAASLLQRSNSLSSFCSDASIQSFPSSYSAKSAVASSSQAGDGPRKRLLSAHTSSVRAQAAKLEVQKNASSVKTPNRGTNRDSTVPGSKTLPRTGSWCARQVGSSTYNQLRADKSRLRSSSTQRPVFRTFRSQTPAPPDLLVSEKKPSGLVHYKTKCDEQVKWIAQLKELLKTSNQRFEGVAIVVQYLQARREEGNKQHKELSQELLNLQGELETRRQTCDKLDREREELEKNYQGVIQKLSEEHQTELRELEERLQQLFTAEQERLQQVLNDDLGKLQTQWQEQVEDINSKHETHKLGLITSHTKKLESLTEDYEQSLAELTRSYELEKHSLEETFNQTQSQLQEQISKLNEENNSLKEKVKAKEQVTKTHVQQDQLGMRSES